MNERINHCFKEDNKVVGLDNWGLRCNDISKTISCMPKETRGVLTLYKMNFLSFMIRLYSSKGGKKDKIK